MIELIKNNTLVLQNRITRDELIEAMKKYGIKVKCFHDLSRLKMGGVVEPALDIRFITAGSGKLSFIHGAKSKELAIELLGLRSKEDCERVNRELEG
ncbi:MAG: hypothetical protein K8R58_05105 [Bacteroidales bacterium]|nr:hypothetical protein [Bacteroidales bacterium]